MKPVPITASTSFEAAVASVKAGFPSLADDFREKLDLIKLLVQHTVSTFFFRIDGVSMADADMDEGDIIIVDRAVEPYIMTTKQMTDLVDRYLDSKGLSNPSIRKRAARKVFGYMDSTGAFLSGGQLALPSDKRIVASAYERHKGSPLNGAEKSAINHIYDLAGSSIGKSTPDLM